MLWSLYIRKSKEKASGCGCEHFFLADPDEQAFATKEYLSKELLQYLLNLELLPTIENAPEMTAKGGTKL